MEQEIINSYINDGYIYCIKENEKYVKLGKTLKKENQLLSRYSTYFPDCKIIHYLRVGDLHKAEKYLFTLLQELRYKGEHYYFNESLIKDAFEKTTEMFPDINVLISKCNPDTITSVNEKIRKIEKNKK